MFASRRITGVSCRALFFRAPPFFAARAAQRLMSRDYFAAAAMLPMLMLPLFRRHAALFHTLLRHVPCLDASCHVESPFSHHAIAADAADAAAAAAAASTMLPPRYFDIDVRYARCRCAACRYAAAISLLPAASHAALPLPRHAAATRRYTRC